MPMPLPSRLQSLLDLTAPFAAEPTLATLRADIEQVRVQFAALPDPPPPANPPANLGANQPAPPVPEPPHAVNRRLRDALALLMAQPQTPPDARPCPTPGCTAVMRWP